MQSLENLVSYPWIHSRLKEGTLSLTGWYFDFETGDLLAYSTETSQFEPLTLAGSPGKNKASFTITDEGTMPANDTIPERNISESIVP